ncbi:MAG: hypothetical protein HY080_14395 [Gammaproteobacteria bacterium]|nr:hypothetical protein [Gammaproteobacteria bacterium]
MSMEFTIEYRGDYLYVLVGKSYEITPVSMGMFWPAITQACEQYQCWRVLSEGIITARRMSTVDAFNSALQAASNAQLTLACCFHGYQPDELTEFFKTVAYNRGVRIEFFSNLEQAYRWLGVEQRKVSMAH